MVVLMRDIGLEQYAALLLRCGFQEVEALFGLDYTEMKDLGMPLLAAVKLRRRVQDLQRQRAEAQHGAGPSHPVVQFLEKAGLPQYADLLLRSGFGDMEALLDIEDTHLKELGVPRGHALKLKKRLREYQMQEFEKEEQQVLHVLAHQQVLQVHAPSWRPGQIPSNACRSMPTERMKSAVEQSWEQVQALGTYRVGRLFYRNTFAIMPEALDLFPTHVRLKYREWLQGDEEAYGDGGVESPALRTLFSKFMNAIGCTVAGLHNPTQLVPMLSQLGARHINYGVCDAHWQAMGKALNATLRELLGGAFTPEVEDAWKMAYAFLSAIMMDGLRIATATRDAALNAAQEGRAAHPSEIGAARETKSCQTRERVVDHWSEVSGTVNVASSSGLKAPPTQLSCGQGARMMCRQA